MVYRIALFLHVCGALALFAAVAIELVGMFGFRRAASVEQVRMYSRIVKIAEPMFPLAAVTLLGAGIVMTVTSWSFTTPFVTVGIVTLVIMAILGPAVQGKTWKAVDQAAHDLPDGPVPAQLRHRMEDPAAWASTGGSVLSALGVVAVMTIKPGWGIAVAIVVAGYALGAVGGRMLVVRTAPATLPAGSAGETPRAAGGAS